MTKPPSELAGNNPGQHAVHDRQDIRPAAEQAPSFSSMDTDAETFNALYQSPVEASAYANKRPSNKRTGEGPHEQKNATGDTPPSTAVSRILARVRSPEVVINNKDLPAEVLRPIQATGVIAKEALPVVSMAFLTALGAASASSTTCEPARELGGASESESNSASSARTAMSRSFRVLPWLPCTPCRTSSSIGIVPDSRCLRPSGVQPPNVACCMIRP